MIVRADSAVTGLIICCWCAKWAPRKRQLFKTKMLAGRFLLLSNWTTNAKFCDAKKTKITTTTKKNVVLRTLTKWLGNEPRWWSRSPLSLFALIVMKYKKKEGPFQNWFSFVCFGWFGWCSAVDGASGILALENHDEEENRFFLSFSFLFFFCVIIIEFKKERKKENLTQRSAGRAGRVKYSSDRDGFRLMMGVIIIRHDRWEDEARKGGGKKITWDGTVWLLWISFFFSSWNTKAKQMVDSRSFSFSISFSLSLYIYHADTFPTVGPGCLACWPSIISRATPTLD